MNMSHACMNASTPSVPPLFSLAHHWISRKPVPWPCGFDGSEQGPIKVVGFLLQPLFPNRVVDDDRDLLGLTERPIETIPYAAMSETSSNC